MKWEQFYTMACAIEDTIATVCGVADEDWNKFESVRTLINCAIDRLAYDVEGCNEDDIDDSLIWSFFSYYILHEKELEGGLEGLWDSIKKDG